MIPFHPDLPLSNEGALQMHPKGFLYPLKGLFNPKDHKLRRMKPIFGGFARLSMKGDLCVISYRLQQTSL